jgi:hypothetical protein
LVPGRDTPANPSKILSITVYGIDMTAVRYGFGVHYNAIPAYHYVTLSQLFFAADMVWTWAICFVKVSVAFMFLRFTRTLDWTGWKAVMCFSIFYLVGAAISGLYLGITTCTPIKYQWDTSIPEGQCRSPKKIRETVLGLCLVVVVSDFQFALLPLKFICLIKRSSQEKMVIFGIMSLGLLASVIGCIKYLHFDLLFSSQDQSWDTVLWKMVSNAEVDIGIIAACIPPLKSLFQKIFKKFSSMESGSSENVENPSFLGGFHQVSMNSTTSGPADNTASHGKIDMSYAYGGLPGLELVLPKVSEE